MPQRLLIVSRGMRGLATLSALLTDYELIHKSRWHISKADAVAVWGRRPTALRTIRSARRHNCPVISLEDGFLRSIGLGNAEPPLSVVVDDIGIYYDARNPSRLERFVLVDQTAARFERSQRVIDLWRSNEVSKYNFARNPEVLPSNNFVLVVDQTKGDVSIMGGLASSNTFHAMLDAAVRENPQCDIYLKVHPDVLARRKEGNFDLDHVRRAYPGVKILAEDSHPVEWVKCASAVYVVTSQLGFEALMWGKRVRVFGMPFYGGWGLTEDEMLRPERRKPVLLEQLVHAALIDYPRYVHPETGAASDVESLIAWVGLQRRVQSRYPKHLQILGFSRWKQEFARDYFQGARTSFFRSVSELKSRKGIVIWGDGARGGWNETADDDGRPAFRVEDGFLRSVGLGATGTRPLSWAIDDLGMYYDPAKPSRLEHILANTEFSGELLDRARHLRERILAEGITKYNMPGAGWRRPCGDRRVILVPGQVEDDASIRFGASSIRRNIDLLRAVRVANPDAMVLYRPHPDVRAGARIAGADEDSAGGWCDEIVGDFSFSELLEQVDEVHVLTSLAGFEALMRGRPTTVYGQPFYAGWGLTSDLELDPSVQGRRTRRLTLDELIAGALICYPTYVSRRSRRYTSPEQALSELLEWRDYEMAPIKRASLFRRMIARLEARKWGR